MEIQMKKWCLIVAATGFTGVMFMIPPVSGDAGNKHSENQPTIVAQSNAPSWSKNNTNYVKPSKAELKKRLTDLQYNVTQEEDTERPFDNAYWNNKKEGIYVDIVSGEPLFSSKDKFKSGTGWPSFTRPIVPDAVVEKTDISIFGIRTELRSAQADSHIGHVFDDGPDPTGLRYCINSAALRFVEKSALSDEGYTEFLSLFDE